MKIKVKTKINATESKERLMKASLNIFPGLEFVEDGGFLIATESHKEALTAVKKLISRQEIREAARHFLLSRIGGGVLQFSLNKQAAIMGKLNFVDFPIALGAIDVSVSDSEPEDVVRWLTSPD